VVASEPLFSIVIVCLNAERHIGGALDSALDQSFEDFEVVVVDGGSTDATLDAIQRSEADAGGRLSWVSEPDDGLYHAMNKGLEMARGTYIEYLGADDRLAPGALVAVADAVSRAPVPDIVCGATRVVGDEGAWDELPRSFARHAIPKRAPARHQSVFILRERILALGGFDTRFAIVADYELYLRLHESGATERLIPRTLSEFRLGGVSNQSALRTAQEYRDARILHGASPFAQSILAFKSAAAVKLVGLWRRAR